MNGRPGWCKGTIQLALAGLLCAGAVAQAPDAEAARVARERARIQTERERIDARFDVEQAGCSERFAVTACLDDVRLRRRAALEPTRLALLALDDTERRARAVARRRAVQDKQRDAAARPVPVPTAAPTVASAPAGPLLHPPQVSAPAARASDAAAAAAARRAAASRRRLEQIQAAQARIEARQAERARLGRSAAPLPAPTSGASASGMGSGGP